MEAEAVTTAEDSAARQRKGWLQKWTNYIKGYRKRWFVLQNGLLSYYRSQEEVAYRCRETVNLVDADVSAEGSRGLRLRCASSPVTFHLRAADSTERDEWRAALQAAKYDAVRLYADEYEDDDGGNGEEDASPTTSSSPPLASSSPPPPQPASLRRPSAGAKTRSSASLAPDLSAAAEQLSEKLAAVDRCCLVMAQRGAALKGALQEMESATSADAGANDGGMRESAVEAATKFTAAASDTVGACQDYANLVLDQGRHWRRLLRREHAERVALQQMVERLARQHAGLERRLRRFTGGGTAAARVAQPAASHRTGASAVDSQISRESGSAEAPTHRVAEAEGSSDGSSSGEEGEEFQDAQDTLTSAGNERDLSREEATAKQELLPPSSMAAAATRKETETLDAEVSAQQAKGEEEEEVTSRISGAASSMGRGSSDEDDEYEDEDDEENETEEEGNRSSSENLGSTRDAADVRLTAGHQADGERIIAGQQLQHHHSSYSDSATTTVKFVNLDGIAPSPPSRQRRKAIPEKPTVSLNLWSVMKNCLGRDLSRIPMPVNFNEPLSLLQRVTEELEYAGTLDMAASCTDQWEQMAYVAAFMVSAYSTTTSRVAKPFNPLLGETYECDRLSDLGWRSITEQVSHHPPSCAMFAEGCKGWTLWQEFAISSKFRGKYLQVTPQGIAHLVFKSSGHHYTWHKVTTTVHNIVVGKLWVDNHGEVDFVNHTTGDSCHLKFSQYSYFSKESQRKVAGVIKDKAGTARMVLRGSWDKRVEVAHVLPPIDTRYPGSNSDEPLDDVDTVGEFRTVWRKKSPPPNLEPCYHFSQLAVELNEPEEGVAPTDARLRPDMRLMEEGRWDEANREKIRLEEKQRAAAARRRREAEAAAADGGSQVCQGEHRPVWFKKSSDSITGKPLHTYTGQYWEHKKRQDWSMCPHIY